MGAGRCWRARSGLALLSVLVRFSIFVLCNLSSLPIAGTATPLPSNAASAIVVTAPPQPALNQMQANVAAGLGIDGFGLCLRMASVLPTNQVQYRPGNTFCLLYDRVQTIDAG